MREQRGQIPPQARYKGAIPANVIGHREEKPRSFRVSGLFSFSPHLPVCLSVATQRPHRSHLTTGIVCPAAASTCNPDTLNPPTAPLTPQPLLYPPPALLSPPPGTAHRAPRTGDTGHRTLGAPGTAALAPATPGPWGGPRKGCRLMGEPQVMGKTRGSSVPGLRSSTPPPTPGIFHPFIPSGGAGNGSGRGTPPRFPNLKVFFV